jgi:CRISPR type IV-associated protein Csf2
MSIMYKSPIIVNLLWSSSVRITLRGVLTITAFTHQTSDSGPGQQMRTNVFAGGRLHHGVPMIQAGSVRALLRRRAAGLMYKALADARERISRGVFNSVSRGAASRTGLQSGGATYLQHIKAREHQFVGLFGGGGFMFHSRFRLERDLIPVIEAFTPLFCSRIRPFAVPLPVNDLYDTRVLFPRDEFAQLPEDALRVVDDVEASYAAHMSTKESQAAAKKSGEADKKDDLNNIASATGITAGVPLAFGLSTQDIEPYQAGILLRALLLWANDNALGGGASRGWGSFAPNITLMVDGKEVVSNIFVGDAPYLEFAKTEQIQQMLDASDQALATHATAAALSELYPDDIPSNVEGKEGKGKRGRKAAPSASEAQPASA